jgi:hypothetical protein
MGCHFKGGFKMYSSNYISSHLGNRLCMVASMVLASCVLSSAALADDSAIENQFRIAQELYGQRSVVDSQSIEKTIETLKAIEGKAEDSDLNYDILILESRALYFKGAHESDNEKKLSVYALGQTKADDAKSINDGYAEAYYFAGINLGRWAEVKGALASISRKGELIAYMEGALERNTREGASGETIDGYGPNRVYGRLYHKLPGILGGSHAKSLEYLKKAYEEAKNLALNVVYYAETLSSGNREEKALARTILDEMLKQDPNHYNETRTPETQEEFEEARKLRTEI